MAKNFKNDRKKTTKKVNNGNDKVVPNIKNDAKRKTEVFAGSFNIRPFEYNMSEAMANDYLADRKIHGAPKEKRMSKYQYLCYCVNEFHGLMGTCVKVHVI